MLRRVFVLGLVFVHLFVCLILRPPLRVMAVFFQLLRLVADV